MDVACVKAAAPLPGGEGGRADPSGLMGLSTVLPGQELCPRPHALVVTPGGDARCETGLKVLLGCCSLSALSPAQRGVSRGLFGEDSFQAALGRRRHLLELEDVF